MPRIARVIVPGSPHHVTQRGNRRQQTFFRDGDYRVYRELMTEWCREHGVEVWAYCLMPNHVRLIAGPYTGTAIAAWGESHGAYPNEWYQWGEEPTDFNGTLQFTGM